MSGTDPIQQGIDYQARWFWLWAAKLLWPESAVAKVWFESGPRGLDDVGIEWFAPRLDGRGRLRHIERHQVKFQVTLDRPMTTEDFVDPDAIGAEKVAFIERARDAYHADRAAGRSSELVFVTDRQIDPTDILATRLYDAGKGTLKVDRLMAAKAGGLAKVRSRWQERVQLGDDEFVELIEAIRIEPSLGTFRRLDDQLDTALRYAGLEGIDYTHRVRKHDDLARKLNREGVKEFDAATLRKIVHQEELVVGPPQPAPNWRIGVRSFRLFAEDLAGETEVLADFVEHFDFRRISDPDLWASKVMPELTELARTTKARSDGRAVEVELPCSMSLAVAAGSVFDPRTGLSLGVVQRGSMGTATWMTGGIGDPFDLERHVQGKAGDEAVVILAISRNVAGEAQRFVTAKLSRVGQTIVLAAKPSAPTAVRNGQAAQSIADQVLATLDELRGEGVGNIHLFAAAPNSVLFMIGRGIRGRGPVTVYDYDYDKVRDGTYEEGITLPLSVAEKGE